MGWCAFVRWGLSDRHKMMRTLTPLYPHTITTHIIGLADYCPFATDFAEVAKRAVHAKIRCQDR